MYLSTKGIVLRSVKYSDTSLIVGIYTEEFGLQSYIIKGIRSKKSRMKTALFQPLQMLDLTVSHRENKKINHLKEAKTAYAFQSIPFDPVKRSVTIFLTEVLNHSIKENVSDRNLFHWLWQSLTWYDLNREKSTDFHLVFMMQLTRFLGFFPKKPDADIGRYFDLMEGSFQNSEPPHPHYVSGETVQLFRLVAGSSFNDLSEMSLTRDERRKILDYLTDYYRLHVENFGEMKSPEVLREL
jgi:DNA repair protein RecO (recombination protein O)